MNTYKTSSNPSPKPDAVSSTMNCVADAAREMVRMQSIESEVLQTYRAPGLAKAYPEVEWVRNTKDGSILHDHKGYPVSVDRLLATKPLRSELSSRPGPGGKKLTYLSGEGVTRTLNDIFGFNGWNLQIMKTQREECVKDDKGRFHVAYTAQVRLTHKRSGTYKEDVGASDSIDRILGTAVAHALKGSITDALKRAARHFGEKLGNTLYQGNFSTSNAPLTLKDALDQYDKETACTKFGTCYSTAIEVKTEPQAANCNVAETDVVAETPPSASIFGARTYSTNQPSCKPSSLLQNSCKPQATKHQCNDSFGLPKRSAPQEQKQFPPFALEAKHQRHEGRMSREIQMRQYQGTVPTAKAIETIDQPMTNHHQTNSSYGNPTSQMESIPALNILQAKGSTVDSAAPLNHNLENGNEEVVALHSRHNTAPPMDLPPCRTVENNVVFNDGLYNNIKAKNSDAVPPPPPLSAAERLNNSLFVGNNKENAIQHRQNSKRHRISSIEQMVRPETSNGRKSDKTGQQTAAGTTKRPPGIASDPGPYKKMNPYAI